MLALSKDSGEVVAFQDETKNSMGDMI
jgi:hypothetical protein